MPPTDRAHRTAAPGRTLLGDLLADTALGQHEKFERLTGLDGQLWWECCRDAVLGQPGWLRHPDHDAALALIGREDVTRSGGVTAGAKAVSAVSQVLAQPPGTPATAQTDVGPLAAADRWQQSRSIFLQPVPEDPPAQADPAADPGGSARAARAARGEAGFDVGLAVATAVPALRARVTALLAGLPDVDHDPGQAMVAIMALLLAAAQPDASPAAEIRVVFGHRGRADLAVGVTATLRLRTLPGGPAGLFSDPRTLRVIRGDDPFAEALRLAWDSVDDRDWHAARRCVLWRLTLDGDVPDGAIRGGSLGAAFALTLRELARRHARTASKAPGPSGVSVLSGAFRVRSALAAVGSFFTGLRPSYAVTGALSVTRPAGYDKTEGPWLGQVGDFDLKLRAARRQGLDLIAPDANRNGADPEGVHWAQTLNEADKQARQVRRGRALVTGLAAVAVLGALTTGIALTTGSSPSPSAALRAAQAQASAQHAAAMSSQLAADAVASIGTNLQAAQLLAVEATKIDNTPQARAALFQAATANPDVTGFLEAGSKVTAWAVAGDADYIVAGTSDGGVVEFDLATGARVRAAAFPSGDAVGSVAVSANGGTVAAADGTRAVIWRPGSLPAVLHVSGTAFSVALSPSGRLAAVLSLIRKATSNASSSDALTVRDLSRGTAVSVTPTMSTTNGFISPPGPPANYSNSYFTELAFPSELVLTLTYAPGLTVDYVPSDLQAPHTGSTFALAQLVGQLSGNSANGAFDGSYQHGAEADGPSGQLSAGAPGTPDEGTGPAEEPSYLTFSDDGKLAATINGSAIEVTDLHFGPSAPSSDLPRPVQLTGLPGTTAVAFVGDSELMAVAGSAIEVWNLHRQLQLGTPTSIRLGGFQTQEFPDSLVMSPDGRYLAVIDVNSAVPTLSPVGDHNLLDILRNGPEATATVTGATTHGAAPVWSGDQLLWLGDNQAATILQVSTANGTVLGSWPVPQKPSFYSSAFRVTSGGDLVIASGGAVMTFNPRTTASTTRDIAISGIPGAKPSDLFVVALSADGRDAVFQDGAASALLYVNLTTGAARVLTKEASATNVVFSGSRLFIGLAGEVQEWTADGGRLLATVPSAGLPVGLSVSPDGTLFAQASDQGVVSVFDAASGQVIASFTMPPAASASPYPWAITTTTFSPDDHYLFTATPGGVLTRWDIGESDLAALACRRAGTSLTSATWDQYIQSSPPANLACMSGERQ